MDEHTRPNRTAIAPRAFQAYFKPVIAGRRVIAQQGWRLIAIHNENIEVPIIIEVTQGAPAAHMRRRDPRTGLHSHLQEASVSVVTEKNARGVPGILGVVA